MSKKHIYLVNPGIVYQLDQIFPTSLKEQKKISSEKKNFFLKICFANFFKKVSKSCKVWKLWVDEFFSTSDLTTKHHKYTITFVDLWFTVYSD